MATIKIDLFQNITANVTEDLYVPKDYRTNLYIACDDGNAGTIQIAIGPDAVIANSKPLAAGERQPFTLQPGQGFRAVGSIAGQKFIITG